MSDPQIILTMHGGQLQLQSNLVGAQAKTALYQILRQAADMALLEWVKEQAHGPVLVEVPRVALGRVVGER